ncbi:MAG: hypothetical protein R2879_11485 [Saprospiraceae bacterium]
MKKNILIIGLLFSGLSFLKAQDSLNYKWVFYSEVTSIFRGNQSLNISFERRFGKISVGAGFDSYFNVLNGERKFRDDSFSYGVFLKSGIDAIPTKPGFVQIGLYLKYASFHIDQLDHAPNLTRNPTRMVYSKDYHKFTPMLYGQLNFFRTSNVYLSFQMAYGYPILFDVESTLNEPNDLLLMEDEYSEYITDLIEHNVHYNRTGAGTQFSFQFNGLIGFRF